MSDAPVLYRLVKGVVTPVLNRWLHLTVDGLDNVPTDRPVILACNHLSFIDSLVLPINVPRPVYFLGKADYFASWRTRWFFRGVGVVPVQREGGPAGMTSLTTGIDILMGGDVIGVYPEGTRSPDGRLYRGKTGPVRMALAAGVDIVPCALIGTDRVQPPGRYRVAREPVTMRYGKPIDLSRHADRADDPFALRAATDEVMYEIMILSGQDYVDAYASSVKAGKDPGDTTTPGGPLDLDRHERDVRRAS